MHMHTMHTMHTRELLSALQHTGYARNFTCPPLEPRFLGWLDWKFLVYINYGNARGQIFEFKGFFTAALRLNGFPVMQSLRFSIFPQVENCQGQHNLGLIQEPPWKD